MSIISTSIISLYTLAINASKADPTSKEYNLVEMPYDAIGKREIPILSVLTITGISNKSKEDILKDTINLALEHLKGNEWCENSKGLEAYSALIRIFQDSPEIASSWSAEYFLGTYGALKEYTYKYFSKYGQVELSELYEDVFHAWMDAFCIKTSEDATKLEVREKIVALLKFAHEQEIKAVELMKDLSKKLG